MGGASERLSIRYVLAAVGWVAFIVTALLPLGNEHRLAISGLILFLMLTCLYTAPPLLVPRGRKRVTERAAAGGKLTVTTWGLNDEEEAKMLSRLAAIRGDRV